MPDDFYSQKMAEATMALQVMAKLVVPEFDEAGNINLRTVTKEEWEATTTSFAPTTPKLIPVEPSTRSDGKVPFAWVFTCPPPYNGVEIACVPDDTTEVGIRCTSSRLNVSRERERYDIVFLPQEPGTHVVVMNEVDYLNYEVWIRLEKEGS